MTQLEAAATVIALAGAIIAFAGMVYIIGSWFFPGILTPLSGGDWQVFVVTERRRIYAIRNAYTGEWLRSEKGARWLTEDVEKARARAAELNGY